MGYNGLDLILTVLKSLSSCQSANQEAAKGQDYLGLCNHDLVI